MKGFSSDVISKMDINGNGTRKYYVYGLIDPNTLQVFYVGKGCGNRVFEHARVAIKPMNAAQAQSLKITTIQNIIQQGKDVIAVIYHWGLTNLESKYIESTLIDAIPGLTNMQSGYDVDHGMILAEDLQNILSSPVYEEPKDADGHNIPYILIKLRDNIDERGGDLYKAARGCWDLSLDNANKIRYVVVVINGIVQEVYDVDNWHISETESPKIEFDGKPTTNSTMRKLVGKLTPENYRKKGMANPCRYCND